MLAKIPRQNRPPSKVTPGFLSDSCAVLSHFSATPSTKCPSQHWNMVMVYLQASFRRLVLVLPKHILACLLSGQPTSPPDEMTNRLTDCSITSMSHFGHIAKALQLLCNLCESASQNRSLRAELLYSKASVYLGAFSVLPVCTSMQSLRLSWCQHAWGMRESKERLIASLQF